MNIMFFSMNCTVKLHWKSSTREVIFRQSIVYRIQFNHLLFAPEWNISNFRGRIL